MTPKPSKRRTTEASEEDLFNKACVRAGFCVKMSDRYLFTITSNDASFLFAGWKLARTRAHKAAVRKGARRDK